MSNVAPFVVPPDLRASLNAFKSEIFNDLNCHQLGEIVEFNSITQTASVQITTNVQTATQTYRYPLLTDCPVFILSGGIGSVMMPVSPGDPCLVLFNDRCIDDWFTTGIESAPEINRMHSLSDGLVLVGFRNLSNLTPGFTALGITLKHPGIYAQGNFSVSTGANGVFTSGDGKTITVADGIIVNIV